MAGAAGACAAARPDRGRSRRRCALARDGGHAFVSSSLRPYADRRAGRARRAGARRAPDARRRRRRPRRARSGRRPARVARAAARALLPLPRRHLRVPPRAAAAPRRPARRRARRAARAPTRSGAARAQAAPRWPRRGPEQPVVVVSAVALSEKVPDPALRPRSFTLRVGELLDLDECAAELVAAGYERVDQVEERGQFAMRGGLLDVFPATEDRAVRVDMFDVEIESLRWFSTFTQRSLGDVEEVEIAPAAELARRAPRAGGDRRGRPCDGERGAAPGHRRAAAGRAASARCSTCSTSAPSWWSPPRRRSRRR